MADNSSLDYKLRLEQLGKKYEQGEERRKQEEDNRTCDIL